MTNNGYFKKNPVRWLLDGDYHSCMAYRGEATKLLWQLKNAMKLGGLQQNARTRFFQDGTVIRVSSNPGQDTIQIQVPPAITPLPRPAEFPKVLYTADYYRNKIVALNYQTGKVLFDFGEEGTGDGQFKQPYTLHGSKGELYITDRFTDRVLVFDYKGRYLRRWGDETITYNPRGICAYKDIVYVCQANKTTAYTTTGQIINQITDYELTSIDLTVYKNKVYILRYGSWVYKIEVRNTNLYYITRFNLISADDHTIYGLDVANNEIYVCGYYEGDRHIKDNGNTIYFYDAWIGIYDLNGNFKRQFFAPLDNWQLWETLMAGCFVYKNEIFAIFNAIGPHPNYDQFVNEIHVYSLSGQLLKKFTNVLWGEIDYRPLDLFIDRGDI